MQFKLTKPRPSPPHSLLSCLACAAATAASTLPSVSGFACRCQALKLNTFLWLIRSVERGKQKSFCYFCCYCCVKRFSVAYFCAPGRSSCGFSRILLSHPPPPPLIFLRLHNFQRIFAGFYFAWFTLIFQPPSPDVLPSSLSLLFTSNVTHSSSRLSLSLTLFACLSVCVCVRVQVYASCFARFCSFITHLTHKSNMCKCFHFICTLIHIKYFRCLLCIAHEASTRNRGKSSSSSSNITRAELSSRRSFSFLFVRVNEVEKRVKYATNSSRWLPCNTHSTSSLRHFTLTSPTHLSSCFSYYIQFGFASSPIFVFGCLPIPFDECLTLWRGLSFYFVWILLA